MTWLVPALGCPASYGAGLFEKRWMSRRLFRSGWTVVINETGTGKTMLTSVLFDTLRRTVVISPRDLQEDQAKFLLGF